MTFTSKCLCHKYYLQSPEGIFKMIELMIGLASWSLLYLGNGMFDFYYNFYISCELEKTTSSNKCLPNNF